MQDWILFKYEGTSAINPEAVEQSEDKVSARPTHQDTGLWLPHRILLEQL